ncbi:TPA: LOW QUALITY PROTEIN: hypothetical protein N0F65_000513 [Lagenidium giganteum]|uniref:DDE Tnp4 domain-containing protein n=1 Tax=Lagenidium giganteum TaxID=4803 RepID=A0AAV2YZI4_9STRA|nr:TPA: LOW QUALITY PROTEIN: hypothetical protein N0F65_000513 [Lagenidium giganteum]
MVSSGRDTRTLHSAFALASERSAFRNCVSVSDPPNPMLRTIRLTWQQRPEVLVRVWIAARKSKASFRRVVRRLIQGGILPAAVTSRQLTPTTLNTYSISEANARLRFRFSINELNDHASQLDLPPMIVTSSDGSFGRAGDRLSETGSAIALGRPVEFGRSAGSLSRINTCTVVLLFTKRVDLLERNENLLTRRATWCTIVDVFWFHPWRKTLNLHSKPSPDSGDSGHKRRHCLIWQAVAPLMAYVLLFEGRKHDSPVLRESRLLNLFREMDSLNGKCVYGDPAYGCQDHIVSPYASNLTTEEQESNRNMSSALWSGTDWHKKMGARKFPLASCLVAFVVTNCHSFLSRGNQTSSYFDLAPRIFGK